MEEVLFPEYLPGFLSASDLPMLFWTTLVALLPILAWTAGSLRSGLAEMERFRLAEVEAAPFRCPLDLGPFLLLLLLPLTTATAGLRGPAELLGWL